MGADCRLLVCLEPEAVVAWRMRWRWRCRRGRRRLVGVVSFPFFFFIPCEPFSPDADLLVQMMRMTMMIGRGRYGMRGMRCLGLWSWSWSGWRYKGQQM